MTPATVVKRALCIAVATTLTGCATFSQDGGFNNVAQLTKERTGQTPAWQRSSTDSEAARARVTELLQGPLNSDAAVAIALLNNPRLQVRLQELGIAEAGLVRAGRLPNPTFSFSNIAGGGIREIERAIVFDVLTVLMMPLTIDIESRRFEQTQLEVAAEAVSVATEARRAFFNAVASQELVLYARQVKTTADASAELARRMVLAGNFNKLAQMREQAFYADATGQLARAQQRALSDRERLIRALGLASPTQVTLPERLPDLPKAPFEPVDAEQTAMSRRLDVLQAKKASEAVAKSLDLTRTTGFINVLNAGYANKSQTGDPRENGYQVEVEIPIFDFGTTRVARAEALYMQSVFHTAEIAINARSEVREAYGAYRTSYDLARHYRDEVVPLRKRISEENLLRYNGMLIGVFELLADARDQVSSVTAAIEAARDYWLAETDLQTALTAGTPSGAMQASPRATASAESAGH